MAFMVLEGSLHVIGVKSNQQCHQAVNNVSYLTALAKNSMEVTKSFMTRFNAYIHKAELIPGSINWSQSW